MCSGGRFSPSSACRSMVRAPLSPRAPDPSPHLDKVTPTHHGAPWSSPLIPWCPPGPIQDRSPAVPSFACFWRLPTLRKLLEHRKDQKLEIEEGRESGETSRHPRSLPHRLGCPARLRPLCSCSRTGLTSSGSLTSASPTGLALSPSSPGTRKFDPTVG